MVSILTKAGKAKAQKGGTVSDNFSGSRENPKGPTAAYKRALTIRTAKAL